MNKPVMGHWMKFYNFRHFYDDKIEIQSRDLHDNELYDYDAIEISNVWFILRLDFW